MKTKLTFLLFLISASLCGQSYNFKPQWKVGDSKKITITEQIKNFVDDELEVDQTNISYGRIKVIDENEENYFIELTTENHVLNALKELTAKLGDKLKKHRDIKLNYSIDKITLTPHLINWEDAQNSFLKSIEEIQKLMVSEAPELETYLPMIFGSLKKMYDTKENIEAIFLPNFTYLLAPYNQSFELGKSTSVTDSTNNPFNKSIKVASTIISTLVEMDEVNSIATIHNETIVDMNDYLKSMQKMMESAFSAMNMETSNMDSTEADEYDLELNNLQIIHFNYSTTWVKQVFNTISIESKDPNSDEKVRREISVTHKIE